MSCTTKYLRRMMQRNEYVVRLEKHIITTGVDYIHDLDSAFGAMGISPRLMVPELASLFCGPQGSVLHIPVHVSESVGGRQSLFALAPSQEIVPGIYIVGGKIFERRVIKRNGTNALRIGDEFIERITDMADAEVQIHAYKVSAIDSQAGSIYFESMVEEDDDDGFDTGDLVNTGDGWCWFCNGGSWWWCGFPCLPFEFEGPILA